MFCFFGIFVLLKIESKEEIFINNIIFNSMYSCHIQICIRIYLVGNCLQIISLEVIELCQ